MFTSRRQPLTNIGVEIHNLKADRSGGLFAGWTPYMMFIQQKT